MVQQDRQFISREPRYVLRPEDNHILSYSTEREHERHSTIFLNLSASGAAFLVHKDQAPEVGALLKIEFPVPGEPSTIAWWAKVMRHEVLRKAKWWASKIDIPKNYVVVGVAFENMPRDHRARLRKALHKQFNDILKKRKGASIERIITNLLYYAPRLLIYAALTAAAFLILYFLSRPGPNYDAERGAPWGQRFNF